MEHCAKSELQPRGGLEMLKGRQKLVGIPFGILCGKLVRSAPCEGGLLLHLYLGLKPQAQSFHPFGIEFAISHPRLGHAASLLDDIRH